jgi:hypothetical protein
VITTSAISTPYNYIMNVGALETIATIAWTSSYPLCPSLTYVLENTDGSSADSSVVFLNGLLI